jgi:hypothetical protein
MPDSIQQYLIEILTTLKAEHNLAQSVLAAAKTAQFPVLVTTADNVLMTPESIALMIAGAGNADAAAALARKADILAAQEADRKRREDELMAARAAVRAMFGGA